MKLIDSLYKRYYLWRLKKLEEYKKEIDLFWERILNRPKGPYEGVSREVASDMISHDFHIGVHANSKYQDKKQKLEKKLEKYSKVN